MESLAPPTKAEKAIATTTERSKTLFVDGYEIHPDADRVGVYLVQTPNRTRKGQTYRNIYEVDLAHQACDCEMFQFHGTCKHLTATEKAVTKALELAAPFLPDLPWRAAKNVPERAKTLSAGQQRGQGGYAASYVAPSAPNLRAQNRIETRAAASVQLGDGQRVDTVTGEVLESQVCDVEDEEERPVRVLPVHGSEEWLRQVDKDFRD